jgi:uncharacterized membrane protein
MQAFSRNRIALIACATLHFAVTLVYSLTRLYSYKSSLRDIGVFNQIQWNLLHHGSMITTATVPFTAQHWLGYHFSPILLLLTPLYALWPVPELFQAVQSLLFAGTGMVLYYALQAAGAKPREAWAGSLLYWLNPYVLSAAIWDFHEIAFSIFLIALALWALCAQRFGAMLAALALLMLTKEHYGLSVAGFGFVWGIRYRDWKRGGALMAIGLAACVLVLAVIMPAFNGGVHPMMDASLNQNRYGWLANAGRNPLQALHNVLLGFGSNDIPGLLYLFGLLCGGLLLPLAAPLYLACGAGDILANLLSSSPFPRHMDAYHSAAIIPVVVIAAYHGYRRICETGWIRPERLHGALLALAFVFPCLFIDYPFTFWELSAPVLAADRQSIAQIERLLPPGRICAQINVGVFFSGRDFITPYPYGLDNAQAVVLRIANPYSPQSLGHFDNPYRGTMAQFAQSLRGLMQQPGWHITYWHAPWLVMERSPATQEESGIRREIVQQIDGIK